LGPQSYVATGSGQDTLKHTPRKLKAREGSEFGGVEPIRPDKGTGPDDEACRTRGKCYSLGYSGWKDRGIGMRVLVVFRECCRGWCHWGRIGQDEFAVTTATRIHDYEEDVLSPSATMRQTEVDISIGVGQVKSGIKIGRAIEKESGVSWRKTPPLQMPEIYPGTRNDRSLFC
jgi:hypothetical protein